MPPPPKFDFDVARALRRDIAVDTREFTMELKRAVAQSRETIASSRKLMAGGCIYPSLPAPPARRNARMAAIGNAKECARLAGRSTDPDEKAVLMEIRQMWIELAYAE